MTNPLCISIFSTLLIFSLHTYSSHASCNAADKAALLSFKIGITVDTTGILSTWDPDLDCCEAWEGIECNPTAGGRVTGLQLVSRKGGGPSIMKGTLSPSLASLHSLEVLVITGLQRIEGSIPENLSEVTNLTQLYLEDLMLQGTIPSSFTRLRSLKALSLSGNHLMGQIPSSLSSVSNLVQLSLSRNLFMGPIPDSFGRLSHLQILDLSHNSLSGVIPASLGLLIGLTYLDLSHNNFTGKIPVSLGDSTMLQDVSLSHNRLTGGIPSQIGGLKSLMTLSLSENLLTGMVPMAITSLPKLWSLNLSHNILSDPFPGSAISPSLLSIDLSYNGFHFRDIPYWIRERAMTNVHLAGCGITGSLPRFLRPSQFNSIDLSDNFLSGDINATFARMPYIEKIKLSNNQLRFDISRITLPHQLFHLDLHSNQIYGSLSGFLKGQPFKFLESLDMSRNQITGEIPSLISEMSNLVMLDLSRNQIEGTIPDSVGQMGRLEWLDVSNNRLEKKIPESLIMIGGHLRHANFRGNRLCGQIPQGRPFNAFPISTYLHNLCLCGKPMPPCKSSNQ
ncbi:hypothetical protein QJS10_CPB11g02356 [Acorus calamus]|uniref:Leucine-rich repeat-containing N-terminal plant-type domain-containing protein n=1 Tax=Acorus calamus TaxID=4465 RepID=A0AAV9DT17_ACOCL|nr:hypothetical protein QJS10_CPB11g02356 [Acorus calamus]